MARCIPSLAEVGIYTYGNKSKNPNRPQVNYVVNVERIRDPQSNRGFKKTYADGRAGEVLDFVKEDPRMEAILDNIRIICHTHLRSPAADGHWLAIGIMDHHGHWIAPAVGELVCNALCRDGYKVNIAHYDLMTEVV